MTTESARDEALRLAREAGMLEYEVRFDGTSKFVFYERDLERLIALARQRPGWVWVQIPPPSRCALCSAEAPWAFAWTMPHTCGVGPATLIAAPKLEEGK
jgi:hypothetical protein